MAVMLVAVDLQIGVVRRKPASPLPQPTTHRRRAQQGRRADGARGILCRSPADFFLTGARRKSARTKAPPRRTLYHSSLGGIAS